jgi:MFS family permease
VTMFSLAYMVCAPLFGYFSDRIGRRRVLICSLLAFALANILTMHGNRQGRTSPDC